jgi:hypothetical protein
MHIHTRTWWLQTKGLQTEYERLTAAKAVSKEGEPPSEIEALKKQVCTIFAL